MRGRSKCGLTSAAGFRVEDMAHAAPTQPRNRGDDRGAPPRGAARTPLYRPRLLSRRPLPKPQPFCLDVHHRHLRSGFRFHLYRRRQNLRLDRAGRFLHVPRPLPVSDVAQAAAVLRFGVHDLPLGSRCLVAAGLVRGRDGLGTFDLPWNRCHAVAQDVLDAQCAQGLGHRRVRMDRGTPVRRGDRHFRSIHPVSPLWPLLPTSR